ncbi:MULTISPECIES: type II toxin-antitoxin system RelB/DinJ family antitoxin [Tissierellales]|jgi:addiction module RelB/DinJ family antitoxin|uniref:Type II toxin-antitoxin system RelB/DinJ family antitoxin n=1 Tax=Acidilutibacter cellobiosedens TaxID=2507161 RepID=A0A410QD76_9FIRM|nr:MULTISPECIES: type II toxin-antitoxin system RelB/DinJ family antitoxin [Tissierellales]MBE6083166.1 type II toxin-antitoxin system RelB/DinJ family antitoxin [Tissierellaceae bacterium]QAT61945.1 type II toxin-antitoxin system RelB/DinJ family antitoxin [Acidilutibacter cellobiosedens]SCL97237.1 addiction module antitoxin, RelB/DinJ family [Sporanaerobacter sp. PP17-6a]
MEKSTTLNLRVNPDVKTRAEEVLTKLGIPMSTAIDIYLRQIALAGGIPFAVTLPKVPADLNADLMTTQEIHTKLQEGFDDIKAGNMQNAAKAFANFRKTR